MPGRNHRGEAVAPLDAAFLFAETATTLMQIGGVLIVDPATAAEPFSVDAVRRLVAARLDAIDGFRKVVEPGSLGRLPRWVDADVDLTAHVVAARLDDPAGREELAGLAARICESPLDRRRPLWELHVVERMGDGRAAVIAKVHHALADGITAVGVLAALLDPGTRAPGPTSGHPAPGVARRVPAPMQARAALGAVRTATRAAMRSAWLVARRRAPSGRPFGGPRIPGQGPLTARRDVSLVSLSLDDVQAVQAAFGVTFHDVVLTVVTGALRAWLRDATQLPARPLVAAIPVSTRVGGAPARSQNQISLLFVTLPVQIDDPVVRLRAVSDEATRSKRLHAAAGPFTVGSLAAAAPWGGLSVLWHAAWWLGVPQALPPVANLVVSSVPGPPVPFRLAGARLVGLYPLGPLFEGVPVNVTAASREDRVEIGTLTCPDLVPAAASFAALVPAALDELRARPRGG